MLCPRCGVALEPARRGGLEANVCRACEGFALSFDAFGKEAPSTLAAIERRLGEGDAPRPSRCPWCLAHIPAVMLAEGFELDACGNCRLVWFDKGEWSALGPRSVSEKRQDLATSMPKPAEAAEPIGVVPSASLEGNMPARQPELASWIVLGGMLSFSIWGWLEPGFASLLALDASFPWRLGALPWLTSVFIHGSGIQLFLNAMFLVIFGDDVEYELGSLRFLLLFFAGVLFGGVAHVVWGSGLAVGASAGVSALIAFYAMAFPWARVGLPLFITRHFGATPASFMIGVRPAFVLWFMLQFLGASCQAAGRGPNHIAHIGGALAGLAGFALWRAFGHRAALPPDRQSGSRTKRNDHPHWMH